MTRLYVLWLAAMSLVLAGCGAGAKSSRGFRLPDGDEVKGKAAFVSLQCHTCHTVLGETNMPAPSASVKVLVVLGGEVMKVKTYGELVTAIIHPSHQLTPQVQKIWMEQAKLSPMGSFNHVMTVEQMIDLVAYLQPKYKESDPYYERHLQ